MIKVTDNIEDIVPLWSEAFGDSREDIVFFCKNVKDAECIAYFKDDVAVSMLYLIKCKLAGKESHYVYAASTFKKYRQNGYMGKLLEYSLDKCGDVCLIPADEKLVDYYKKRGFTFVYGTESLKFNQCKELINEYLFEGCSLNNPIVLGSKGE